MKRVQPKGFLKIAGLRSGELSHCCRQETRFFGAQWLGMRGKGKRGGECKKKDVHPWSRILGGDFVSGERSAGLFMLREWNK